MYHLNLSEAHAHTHSLTVFWCLRTCVICVAFSSIFMTSASSSLSRSSLTRLLLVSEIWHTSSWCSLWQEHTHTNTQTGNRKRCISVFWHNPLHHQKSPMKSLQEEARMSGQGFPFCSGSVGKTQHCQLLNIWYDYMIVPHSAYTLPLPHTLHTWPLVPQPICLHWHLQGYSFTRFILYTVTSTTSHIIVLHQCHWLVYVRIGALYFQNIGDFRCEWKRLLT